MVNNLVNLVPTKGFSVYDVVGWECVHRSADSYKLLGPLSKQLLLQSKAQLAKHGVCILQELFGSRTLSITKASIAKLVSRLTRVYDEGEDEFVDVDKDELHITRLPRIGRGKHNVHFDPEFSPQHQALVELVSEGRVTDILTNYWGQQYSLRETGFTMTRPMTERSASDQTGITDGERELYHGGMEWHSDGAQGEATMLLSLTGISESMGAVRVIPGSHRDYVDGVGFAEEILAQRKAEHEDIKVEYVYEVGSPLLFDSRTLHSVGNNHSSEWRVLIWFIFDCY